LSGCQPGRGRHPFLLRPTPNERTNKPPPGRRVPNADFSGILPNWGFSPNHLTPFAQRPTVQGTMKKKLHRFWGGLAIPAILCTVLFQSSCRTPATKEAEQSRIDEMNQRGDVIVFISPERKLGGVVKGYRPLLDAQLPTDFKLASVREFPTSATLATFLASIWPPRIGDAHTYTNAACFGLADTRCDLECRPLYGSNHVISAFIRDVPIIPQPWYSCVRTNSNQSCTEIYQTLCVRLFFLDTDCTRLWHQEPINGWKCP